MIGKIIKAGLAAPFKSPMYAYKGISKTANVAGEGAARTAKGTLHGFNSVWEKDGWGSSLVTSLSAGMLLGGASAVAGGSTQAPKGGPGTRYQEGSAYSGANGFGSRRATKALEESTQGLVEGMHRARHG